MLGGETLIKQPRLPNQESPRIVVNCSETKRKLTMMGDKNGETIKEIIKRLVGKEFSKWEEKQK